MIIQKGVSYVENDIISDKDILYSIGVISYSKLQNLFPDVFQYFPECKLNSSNLGVISSEFNIWLEYESFELKRQIIFAMLDETYETSVRFLIGSSDPPNLPLLQCNDFSVFWILLCFVNIFLIVFCTSIFMVKNKEKMAI